MKEKLNVLLLEDNVLDAELIKRTLVKGNLNFDLCVVGTKAKFQNALRDYPADIILSDHSLPNFDSHEALEMIKASGLIVPFILITSTMTDEFAVQVMQAGADDYIIKDRLHRLPSAVTSLVANDKQKKAERESRYQSGEELKYLNHRLLLATKSANIGIWEWNIVTNHLEWDETMYQLYQIKPNKFTSVYDCWFNRVCSEDRESVQMALEKAITGKEKYETQFRVNGEDGQVRHLRGAGLIEYDDANKPVRMIGINWDITPRVSANLERESIIKDLVERNAALEQFTYIVSHNLRAPIANIMGATGLLSDVDTSFEDRQHLTKGINESVVKLDSIVRDLNYLLGDKGDLFNHNEMIDFAGLIEDIKKGTTDFINDKDLVLTYDFSAVAGLFTLKPYLNSVFYNLISNSIKYRRKGIPSVISVKSEKIDNKLELTFTDNGTGINMEKHGKNIFGLYKRFHTDIDGKGMGLFMVKTQVEKLGGRISVTSTEGEKTEFKITFPL
jgi:signal transduction histidine kinase/DNA-binding response OmpR family regulator